MPSRGRRCSSSSPRRRRRSSSSSDAKAQKKRAKEKEKAKERAKGKKRERSSSSSKSSEAPTEQVSSDGASDKQKRKAAKSRKKSRSKSRKRSKSAKAAKDSSKSTKAAKHDAKAVKATKDDAKVAKDDAKEEEKPAKAAEKPVKKTLQDVFEKAVKPSTKDVKEPPKGSKDVKAPPGGGDGAPKPRLLDLAALQQSLEKDKDNLQLYVLKAKQEHEEKKETAAKREQREKEYFKASYGEICGPDNRFMLEAELGRGVFSSVFRAQDMRMDGKLFAIKFIRGNVMLKKAYEKEVKLMRKLRTQASEKDPEGARCLLGLLGAECFEHQGHLALIFSLQKCDLRSGLAKYGQGHGLPMPNVRDYTRDILLALRALRTVNVVHSDLKPDNLLMSLDKASVRLSDFGCAMDVGACMRSDDVQPRFYRAPEVMLGQSYGTQIDVWSAGVTVFELATGRILFRGESNNGMLHQILQVRGAFSKKMCTSGFAAAKHFAAGGDFKLKESGAAEVVLPMAQFAQPSRPLLGLLEDGCKASAGVTEAGMKHLADLIGKCLVPDPAERATPEPLLAHRFFLKVA